MKKLLATIMTAIGLASGVVAATIDLSALKDHKTLADGDIATGRLAGKYKISIAADATVTFRNVVIPGGSGNADVSWAGVSCKGDATIILEGTNNVTACHDDYPAIFCAGQLTIKGGGTLNAFGGSYGAGIGSGRRGGGGQVIIEGGKVNAYGGEGAAGIGGSDGRYGGAWSAIVIKGGIVYARGGRGGAGLLRIQPQHIGRGVGAHHPQGADEDQHRDQHRQDALKMQVDADHQQHTPGGL